MNRLGDHEAMVKADELLLNGQLTQASVLLVSHGALIMSKVKFCRGNLSEYWLGAADHRSL